MNQQQLELMKSILAQSTNVKKLEAQQKDASNLADSKMLELEALQMQLAKNTDKLINLLKQ